MATPTATGAGTSSAWCRTTPSRPRGRELDVREAEVRSGCTSSTTRRPTRRVWPNGVQKILKASGVSVTRDSISQTGLGLLVKDREDPEQHPGHLHPVAARPAGSGLRAAAEGRGQVEHQAVRLGRSVRARRLEDHRLVRLGLPVQLRRSGRQGVLKAHHGNGEFFGAPVLRRDPGHRQRDHEGLRRRQGNPLQRCASSIAKTKLKTSILGLPVSFSAGGEMKAPAGSGSTRSRATARSSASANARADRITNVRPTPVGRTFRLRRYAPA